MSAGDAARPLIERISEAVELVRILEGELADAKRQLATLRQQAAPMRPDREPCLECIDP